MTINDITCSEDEDVGHVARNMGENLIRRLPVLSRESRLVGVVSLSNIAQAGDSDASTAPFRSVTGAH
ncbi:CBS domain-containing protein [Pseudomonas sp. BIGb0408]|uniref:CBS domain-containing protein n=1 Tax=Phytopseudomonas flavescens TaxID=29435 RepID=A0A7Y9XNY7_9GAMM|nr:CBS domain-containing protein [Pseudomonas sp. BIGb0408]NYH73487.1 CBS domain-containing protein [Pseudomonas flavescens]